MHTFLVLDVDQIMFGRPFLSLIAFHIIHWITSRIHCLTFKFKYDTISHSINQPIYNTTGGLGYILHRNNNIISNTQLIIRNIYSKIFIELNHNIKLMTYVLVCVGEREREKERERLWTCVKVFACALTHVNERLHMN